MEPSYSGDTKVNAPSGDIPTNGLQVFVFLYAEKVALCDGSDDGRWIKNSVQSIITLVEGMICWSSEAYFCLLYCVRARTTVL